MEVDETAKKARVDTVLKKKKKKVRDKPSREKCAEHLTLIRRQSSRVSESADVL